MEIKELELIIWNTLIDLWLEEAVSFIDINIALVNISKDIRNCKIPPITRDKIKDKLSDIWRS